MPSKVTTRRIFLMLENNKKIEYMLIYYFNKKIKKCIKLMKL